MPELTGTHRQHDRKRWWEIHDKETYICPDCGRRDDEVDEWHVHHIGAVPHKIVGLCDLCHKERHGATRWRIDLESWKREFVALGDD